MRSTTYKINYRALAAKQQKNVQISEQAPGSQPSMQATRTNSNAKKTLLKNRLREPTHEELSQDINELICSNEMKSGTYDFDRVATVARLRL
mmetsp:Transcript_29640/g.39418  ORF Transcript_29640/g.39418 Transcript_29640/m.39418 type:complete len:92 (+) Transcript_29640:576-851(+)|eukprot:CAMPEP_0185570570 /NCGR_PEP_ID=MMETSP0434-20130131/2836_1 /TAXON_ID=626734 ORGANISM="Favella taraikaensis, Strain Fe Narragansett Bay" /NCGR_SAMPLE_ID=MMETSP0434 /ASSEMBLY_ACC=CAM_ASM_000379 /LENGTH=91 /DNA_ID=CAMNT_0028185727 /DNA_START=553 /DNA_END=828 /DNA_ORIENTATION=-